MELDHVIFAVDDLEAAALALADRHGLVAVAGGRHPGWGTANMIVPLGDGYLELAAVADAGEAARSAFGRWVAGARGGLDRPLGWAVRTSALDAVAGRLGLDVFAGSRIASDGRVLRWRLAGVAAAAAEPALPFFIEWGAGTPLPGRAAPAAARIARVSIGGDGERLAGWLGGATLPVVVRPGAPALEAVVLEGAGGEIVVGAAP